MNWGRVALTGK